MHETAIEIAESVRAGERKAVEVLDACLAEVAAGNERLNAFVHLDEEQARAAAERGGRRGRRAASTLARTPACPSA